jgi:PAS domain-containing protein
MRFLQGMANMASGVPAMESAAWDTMVHQLEKDLGHLDEDGHFDAGEGDDAAGHSNLKIPLYAPPVQRQRWGDDQVLPHIDWGDIFFDLFYVAAAYNLGALLISSMSRENWLRGIIYFVGIFGPLFLTWETDLFYSSRYTVVDYSHRLFELVRFVFVSFAVLHIKSLDLLADTKHSIEAFSFTLSILLESLMHLGLNCELYCRGLGDRDAIKNHSMLKIKKQLLPTSLVYFAAFISAAVLYFGAADNNYEEKTVPSYGYDIDANVEDTDYRRTLAGGGSPYEESFQSKPLWELTDLPFTLTAAGYVANIVTTTIRKYRATSGKHGDIHKKFVPNNVDYLIHRYGEWIMLMIGESILSLLIVETTESHEYYTIESLGVVTVIILQLLKFESEPSHADGHALWRNIRNATCFSLLIQVLSMGLIAFGVSYKVFLTSLVTQQAEGNYRRALAAVPTIPDSTTAALFCGSLAVVLVSLELMLTTHQGVRKTYQRLFRQISEHQHALNWPLAILSIFKVTLILFQATLSSWISDPVLIVTIGFLVVTTLAVTRIVGWGLVHHERAIKEFVSNVANSSKQAARNFVQKVSFGLASERDDNSQGRSRHSDASRRKDNKDEQRSERDAASGASISTGKGSLNGKEDVYDEMFDAVVITDLKGSILKVNQVTLDVFGYDSKKELTGRNVSILVGGGGWGFETP